MGNLADHDKEFIKSIILETINSDVCEECERHFVIMYGEPGEGKHNLGRALAVAANTHKKEIENNNLPYTIPTYRKKIDKIFVFDIHLTTDIMKKIETINPKGRVVYLGIFAHAAPSQIRLDQDKKPFEFPGALFINDASVVHGNLGALKFGTFTSVPDSIKNQYFLKVANSQVRLFGCNTAVELHGIDKSIARQFAQHMTGFKSYGYKNTGGSMMTNDKALGHGKKAATKADWNPNTSDRKDIWFVPLLGKLEFREFP